MLVIALLPKSKCLLISWLQSPSSVILEPQKMKSITVSLVSPSICHEMMGPDAMIFVFWMLSHPYMTTGKTIALTPWTFVSKLMSLLFNVLSCFPGDASGKEPACWCRRYKKHGFNLWVRKMTWSRAWQPTALFLPEEFHGQRSLSGYSPWDHKESDAAEWLHT